MKKIILILLAIIYAASPYDLLPDFLIGWGWLDDLAIGFLLYRYVLSPVGSAFSQDAHSHRGQRRQRDSAPGGNSGAQGNRTYEQASDARDPYAVLGIDRGASNDEIQKAYHALANKYHPDKVQHLGEEFRVLAEERFKEIRQAYAALREP